MQTVAALFNTVDQADQVIARLEDAGYSREVLGILAREDVVRNIDDSSMPVSESESGDEVVEGATSGAVLGGVAGLIAGIAALAVPGLGLVLTAGTAAAALGSTAVGAGIGAAAGGALGALIDLGIPEEDAETYAEGIKRGGILVAVNATEDRVDEVMKIFADGGAVDMDSTRSTWQTEGWTGFDPSMDPGDRYPTLI